MKLQQQTPWENYNVRCRNRIIELQQRLGRACSMEPLNLRIFSVLPSDVDCGPIVVLPSSRFSDNRRTLATPIINGWAIINTSTLTMVADDRFIRQEK